MACRVSKTIPKDLLDKAIKKCTITLPRNFNQRFSRKIKCFQETKNYYYFPKTIGDYVGKYVAPEPKYDTIEKVKLTYKLYDGNDQNDIDPEKVKDQVQVSEILKDRLRKNGVALLHASTGFGKTKILIHLLNEVGFATVILCHSNKVRLQWEAVLRANDFFVNMGGDPANKNFHIYINTPGEIKKFTRAQLSRYGLVIVDELHVYSECLVTSALLQFTPRFVIGASATPDTKTGTDRAFPLYYGLRSDWIVRMLKKDFIVYQVKTPFKIQVEKRGNMEPHLEALKIYYNIPEIYELVGKIIEIIGDRRCMVMYGLKEEGCDKLRDYFDKSGFSDYTYFAGTEDKYDNTKKVLLTNSSKCSYGFDDQGLSVLIFLHDTLDIRQAEGRARGEDFFIFDICHPREQQVKHASARKKWYKERGGEVIQMRMEDISSIIVPSEEEVKRLKERKPLKKSRLLCTSKVNVSPVRRRK